MCDIFPKIMLSQQPRRLPLWEKSNSNQLPPASPCKAHTLLLNYLFRAMLRSPSQHPSPVHTLAVIALIRLKPEQACKKCKYLCITCTLSYPVVHDSSAMAENGWCSHVWHSHPCAHGNAWLLLLSLQLNKSECKWEWHFSDSLRLLWCRKTRTFLQILVVQNC